MKKLLILRSAALAASLVTMSFASLATDTTSWNFTTNGTQYGAGNYDGNNLNFSSADNNLTITAWADTRDNNNSDTIQTATAAHNSHGLLNYNRDESNNEHYVDNYGDETDMLLFTFDDLVSITGINIGYHSVDSDISIAAFDDLPTLQGNTWDTVASNADFKTSFSNLSNGWTSLSSASSFESKYWLIGAYNGAFGSPGWTNNNDQLKIAGLSTVAGSSPDPKPPTDVAEPSSLAVLASFGLFAAWRRRKSA
ncbi:PEP-CTERM sorting domain-containing protein [Paraglaciecola chathamensis]|uniref:PEP-CTERM sorting domain-containing protein n=1 Tax=Paraglaciecola chathamensis TaxID=368405 RepID=A0ABS0W8Y6_9ALTE|nr:exosortase-dependent surface protein XDP1 [Paraglaciecola chathamensis]MBJ2134826.1 PEP-CTERM sorting domain-containing protein [Paraglaciecola chathamensis]|tara:strand:+ start:2221 stop:2979 length:759 start_codon:yes stop_codon:yes gene_type:complete